MAIDPPKFTPRQPSLIQGFAAPQFDSRFHTDGPRREHTVLGLMVEAYARGLKHPEERELGSIKLMWQELGVLMTECYPEVLKEIEEAANGTD